MKGQSKKFITIGLFQDFAVDSEGPLTARDFWANRGKKAYSYMRPNSMMNTYTKKQQGKRMNMKVSVKQHIVKYSVEYSAGLNPNVGT